MVSIDVDYDRNIHERCSGSFYCHDWPEYAGDHCFWCEDFHHSTGVCDTGYCSKAEING